MTDPLQDRIKSADRIAKSGKPVVVTKGPHGEYEIFTQALVEKGVPIGYEVVYETEVHDGQQNSD